MAKVWLMIIDPKENHGQNMKASVQRLFEKNDETYLYNLGADKNIEVPKVGDEEANAKFAEKDFVYLLFKPYKDNKITIGGGIYARLIKDDIKGKDFHSLKLKERYINKPLETVYLSTIPFIPALYEENFTENLYLIGEK